MANLATIAKQEYNNVISANPTGSAYAYSASTGVLDANFGATIGDTDSIQIITQGYQFAWKPDTVNVLDSAGNLTLLDSVNANAAAQVWNNKITYVGTTAATSDEFVVNGNQLKHSVRMVAPPVLPSGFTATPVSLAIGGDIGTTAQDWANIDLWADGTTHTSDFVTSDDLSFRLKSDGTEIYRIPHISITDDAGNEQNGQYKLVFGANNVVTLYMLCPWDWMQSAIYPVIIDPTVIVSSAYDTSGNGGRKIVRLSNGWIVAVATDASTHVHYFYVSKDNGQTWSQLCYVNGPGSGSYVSSAMASSGTNVYFLFTYSNSTGPQFAIFDASTITNANIANSLITTTDTVQGSGLSLELDGTGALHTAWSSKNSTYSNSYNIRYSKGTVSGTTVTWATPTQISTLNTSGVDNENPCIVVNGSNNPTILCQHSYSSGYGIYSYVYNGTSWSNYNVVYSGGTYPQNDPCSAIDGNNVIHAVWQGYSATYGSIFNIMYSKSTDGGTTWSSPTFLTAQSSYHKYNPTLTISTANDLYVFYEDVLSTTWYINLIKFTASSGAWGTPSAVTSTGTASSGDKNPQALWSEYNMNSSDAVRMIYDATSVSSVEYYTITLNSPPNAPILNAVSNFDATSAQSLSWTFSDPDPGDTQSAFQLQIVDTGTSTTVVDTGKVASTAGSYSVAANTLTNGHNYQWRVTTWDNSGAQGPYSAYSTFSCAAGPSVTITSPASSASITTSGITVQWSYSDSGNNAQQSFEVQLLDASDATVLEDSGIVTSSNTQYTLSTTLSNNTTYHVKVKATNSQSVSSAWADNSFTTSFTTPATPSVAVSPDSTNAGISISITNPIPGSGQPSVASNTISRRITGTSTWYVIASNIQNNGHYVDYVVGSGVSYDYKVTAIANNGTQVDSAAATTSVTFIGDWVYNPTSGQQFQFIYNRKAYSLSVQEERKEVQTFGTKPMVRRGPLNARAGTLDALMVKIGTGQAPIQQLQAFEADIAPHNAYYLKTAVGEVFKVDLHNVKRAMPKENLNSQAIGISVDWTEIA